METVENCGGKEEYYRKKHRFMIYMVVILIAGFVVFGLSMTVGFYEISFTEVYETIFNHITGNIVNYSHDDIIWNTRLPTAIFALIAGASLSIGGAIMQTTVRNPLADPYTKGIASGASLGASLSIIVGVTLWEGFNSHESLVTMAFAFSMIPTAIIMAVSAKKSITPSKMILVGIAVMYVFSAATSLLMLTTTDEQLQEVYSWNVGSLSAVTWESIPIPFVVCTAAILVLMLQARKINVMMSGPTTARTLGLNSKRYTLFLLILVSLMTASVVCFCGTIGFIGLVGPHVARIFVGSESKYLIPTSGLIGGLFLLIANDIAKVSGGMGLPVGVVCAVIGCPLFIFILVKMRKRVWA